MTREVFFLLWQILVVAAQNYYEPAVNFNYDSSIYVPAYGASAYGDQDIFADYSFDELTNRCEGITYTACQKLLREDLVKGKVKL